MKKILVIALSALLLLALFVPAMAADEPKFTTTVSATKVKRGQEITITVTLDKEITTRGIGFSFKSLTDETTGKFTYVSGAYSAAYMAKGPILANVNEKQSASAFASATAISAGEVFTVTLKAKEDADFGSVQVVVEATPKDASNKTMTVVNVGATVEIYHDCVPAAEYVKTDATKHWKECTVAGCTKKIGEENHKFDASCDETCDICGYTRVTSHSYTKQNKDANQHWNECDCGAVDATSKQAHTGGTATCKDKAKCEVCGESYGALAGHTPQEVANSSTLKTPATCKDKAVYNVTCSICGQNTGDTFQSGEADPTKHTGGKATCKAAAVCTVCGNSYGALDPNNHTGVNTTEPKEPATCKKAGKTEKVICECGKVITESTPIEKLAHKVSSWTEVKAATATEKGQKKGTCTVCDTELTVETGKLVSALSATGIKATPVGETKLLDEMEVLVENWGADKVQSFEVTAQEALAAIPGAAGKKVVAVSVYGFVTPEEYTDIASGDKVLDESVPALPGTVKIEIPVAAAAANYENLIVVTEVDGVLKQVEATIEGGKITVDSDSIMNGIVLMGTPKKAANTTANPNIPQNGDSSNVVFFTVIAILSLGGLVITKRAKASK